MYTRTDQRGNAYQFSTAPHTFSDFTEATDATATEDNFRTLAYNELDREEGVAFGRGSSSNPDRAEAYKHLTIHDGADALISGEYKLVVENAAGKVVAVIDRGRTDEVNKGDPSTDSRGDWGKPAPYRAIRDGKGEVLGGQ